eukprot:3297202-Rhodomonas_salina.1
MMVRFPLGIHCLLMLPSLPVRGWASVGQGCRRMLPVLSHSMTADQSALTDDLSQAAASTPLKRPALHHVSV